MQGSPLNDVMKPFRAVVALIAWIVQLAWAPRTANDDDVLVFTDDDAGRVSRFARLAVLAAAVSLVAFRHDLVAFGR